MQTLRLLDKNKRKDIGRRNRGAAGADARQPGVYGSWISDIAGSVKKAAADITGKTDEVKQAVMSELFGQSEAVQTMDDYIQQMISQMTLGSAEEVELIKPAVVQGVEINGTTNEVSAAGVSEESAASFDPRLVRFDAFKTGDALVPFSDATAASVYYDMVYSVEKAVAKMSDAYEDSQDSGNEGTMASDRVAPNKDEVRKLKQDPDLYGTQSLMNPYCVTRLVGGLSGIVNDFHSNMYDIRDHKRFYDHAGFGRGSIVETQDDYVSITNPTTTNIITWSNKDRWGRTPYSFQDFVFCKYWNKIPNNRLITFRKYAVPTYDNLNFPGMDQNGLDSTETQGQQNSGTDSDTGQKKTTAPIATVVSYFGGESPNKLNDFINFTTGTPWKDLPADVHQVQGDTGDDPRAVIDRMFEHTSGFGGVNSDSNIVQKLLGRSGSLTGQYFSFAKFTGLLQPQGYTGHNQLAFEKLTSANVDPTDQIYSNRIYGPVNRVTSVKKREPGIEFSQQFKLVCEYVARPIGGVNTKAAMLDILSNCMEIASPEAVFWGGGYRFMIKPHMYPFKNTELKNNVMASLYAGRIFGTDGAISNVLSGIKSLTTNENGEFDWSTVATRIGDILGQTVSAIGSMIQSVSSSLFGDNNVVTQFISDTNKSLGLDTEEGKKVVSNFTQNLNKMWNDHVIQQTLMPSISGMRALLIGSPVGNWHLTVGNPLNPIMVVGNLICTKMQVEMGEELGPDDFPLELKVTYTIEHGMPRDKAGIQSMFNRGAGKIYKLPDYIRAVSDYETKVDDYTGKRFAGESWMTPQYMNVRDLMSISGARGYQTMKYDDGSSLQNSGNAATTFISKFTPPDPQRASEWLYQSSYRFLSQNKDSRSLYFPNLHTQKSSDN